MWNEKITVQMAHLGGLFQDWERTKTFVAWLVWTHVYQSESLHHPGDGPSRSYILGVIAG